MGVAASCRFPWHSYLKAALFTGALAIGGAAFALAVRASGAQVTGAPETAASETAAPAPADLPGYEAYLTGSADAPRQAEPEPGMVLMGGGNWNPSAMSWFLDLAGRGHVLVLRASGAGELGAEMYGDFGGTASVETLVFSSREAADDPVVLEKIQAADGIFIAGGDQARYVRFWRGTRLARALDQHVADGKPIGGTSAGLAILGGTAYGALDDGSLQSEAALAEPAGNAITLVEDFLHLPLMADIVTDTHFNQRGRLGRLIAFIARARVLGRVHTIGLGIDEGGTLAVAGDGMARYYGPEGTYAWIVRPLRGVPRLREGQPLDWHNIEVRGVQPGGLVDMTKMVAKDPGFRTVVSVHKGRLEPSPERQKP